jgi:hypothetical protein
MRACDAMIVAIVASSANGVTAHDGTISYGYGSREGTAARARCAYGAGNVVGFGVNGRRAG